MPKNKGAFHRSTVSSSLDLIVLFHFRKGRKESQERKGRWRGRQERAYFQGRWTGYCTCVLRVLSDNKTVCHTEYAQVLRMLGNGRLEAFCFDGTKRLCHIRGKMRKKVWINQVPSLFSQTSEGLHLKSFFLPGRYYSSRSS